MNKKERMAALRQMIAEKSLTADGFRAGDAADIDAVKSAKKYTKDMADAGLLYRERVGGSVALACFATPALAKAFASRQQAATLKRAAANACFSPKPARPALSEVLYHHSQAVKPTQATPRKDATIIWPEHIKPVCRMMADRHAVSVPMVRIGEPGWSMTVGVGT